MLDTVRRQEIANAIAVAGLWAAMSVAIGVAGPVDLSLPMLSSLVIYAAVEIFRFSRGTPLAFSDTWRMATLAFWTVIGYETFVAGHWYLLPITVVFLGIVLIENWGARGPSTAAAEPAKASTHRTADDRRSSDAPSCQSGL